MQAHLLAICPERAPNCGWGSRALLNHMLMPDHLSKGIERYSHWG